MKDIFDYYSLRAKLARLHRTIARWQVSITLASVLLLGWGAWLLLESLSIGWFVVGCGVFLLAPLMWDDRYLKNLPATKGNNLDDRLEIEVLARLPYNVNRTTLAETLVHAVSVQFMMVRAGISPQFLSETCSEEVLKNAWKFAITRKTTGIVRGSDFLAGLVATDPALEGLLPHLQLDQHDVNLVADWYDHIGELIAHHTRARTTGGIARDWSFGYSHLLEQFGVNFSERAANGSLTVDVEAHQQALDFMVKTLSTSTKANVALIGAPGSGKTTIVEAFAERLILDEGGIPDSLRYRQVVQLDAASLIGAAADRGQLETLMTRILNEAYYAKNIILCFDDAELFFEEGVGSVNIANLLKPVLEGGVLKVILSMDEQRFLQLSERNPAVAQALNRYIITPASREETLHVLQDQIIPIEFQQRVTYMYQALQEAYRLSERYMHDIAQPGRALQLLTSASQYANDKMVIAASVQAAIEKTMGVKVAATASVDEKEKLLNLEAHIHERMINQKRAVQVVSDALRRARAGVRNEKRPIGTFLFLGPTGVGKTELAKSLAEVYFDGEGHLLRLDMNEFVSPDDVRRLIADGSEDQHSLTAQVMKQPFAVVLLDEIEKAHDSVLATLLQVLDEGILRDIKGREVSFRDAIIIATSNAGADQIRYHIEQGEDLEQFEKEFEDELVNSKAFRPEFLNRFDEIVLFRPLTQLELAKVVDLIIDGVNKTLEPQKISVEIDTELKAWLVVKGNDPRLGARPMRRMVQRVVENIMAKRMLAGEVQPGETVSLTLADIPEEMK